jgi:hypothetical protein
MKDMLTERENTHSDVQPRQFATPFVHAEVRSGPGGGLLIGAGAMLLLAATGMLLIPSLMPAQAWLVSGLADRGVTSLPLFAAGLLFTGLWLAVRTSREHSIAAQVAAMSAGPAIENLSERLVDLRDGIQGLRIEFVYVKDLVQAQIDRQNQASRTDTHAESIYRLAASLDQLGQRVEQQISASQHEVREKLESLWSAMEVARHAGHDGRIHLGGEEETHGEPTEEAVELHGPVEHPHHHDEGSHRVHSEHDEAASRERLGVLDLLDDLGRLLPKKSAASAATPLITSEAFEGVRDEGWERHQALAGPLPSIRLDAPSEASRVGDLLASEDVHEPSDDLAIVRKLEELRALLADSRVRDALTTMDRVED